MTDDKTDKTPSEETTAKPTGSSRKAIKEDYAKATRKDKLAKFYIDPTTKTLQRK